MTDRRPSRKRLAVAAGVAVLGAAGNVAANYATDGAGWFWWVILGLTVLGVAFVPLRWFGDKTSARPSIAATTSAFAAGVVDDSPTSVEGAGDVDVVTRARWFGRIRRSPTTVKNARR